MKFSTLKYWFLGLIFILFQTNKGNTQTPISQQITVADSLFSPEFIQHTNDTTLKSILSVTRSFNSSDPIKALSYYKVLIRIVEEMTVRNQVIIYADYGWNLNQRHDYDSAILFLDRALALNEQYNMAYAALIYQRKGAIMTNLVDYTQALTFYQRALLEQDTLENPSSTMDSHNMIGHLYRKLENYDKALAHLNRALFLSREMKRESQERNILNEIANVYYYLKDYENVRKMDHELEDAHRRVGNFRHLSFTLHNLGEDYNAIEQYRKATAYFEESLALKKNLGGELHLISTYLGLAFTSSELDFWPTSDRYLDSAKQIALKNKLDSKMGFYKEAFKIVKKRGQFDRALEYHEQYIQYKDSIYNRNNANEIAQLNVEFETEKKQRENIILERSNSEKDLKIEKQQLQVILLGGGGSMLTILMFVGYRLYLERKRVAQKLSDDKQTITKQANKLQALDAFKSRFFANVSHDLRTPLTLIQGHIFQIKNEENYLNTKSEDSLLKLETNTKKLIQLTDEIRDLILLEDDRLKLNYQKTEINSYLKRVVNLFSSAASMRKVNLRFQSSNDDHLKVHVDPFQLEKILYNLLSNAFKFTPSGGEVIVELSEKEERIVITIEDDGAGISEDKVDHIFDRYYQATKSIHSSDEGIGIGLALVQELVELHGGSIQVESKLGHGARFSVLLPFNLDKELSEKVIDTSYILDNKDLLLAGETGGEHGAIIDTSAMTKRNETAQTVLIVDDHPDIRDYIKEIIEDQYTICQASNGKEALSVLTKEKVDIVITDLMMPWLDGHGLIEEMKKQENLKNIPILVVSARTAEEDKLKVLEQGVNDFLAKPFQPNELKLRITNALVRKSSGDSIWETVAKDKKKLNDIEKNILGRINKAILSKIDDPLLSVQDLADEMTASRRNAFRLINELTQMNPKDYIRHIRFQYVEDLLKRGKVKSLTEAAQAVGMSNPTHFGKNFKIKMGVHPSELIAQQFN